MGLNLKIYFKNSPNNIYFYDTGFIKTGNSGTIKFYWRELGIEKILTIEEFKKNGLFIENTQICQYQTSIESNVDIMIGCSNSENVYRVNGSLPYLGGDKFEITNFDKICLPLFDTSVLLQIDSKLLSNNKNVKKISYFFSDHREWRTTSDTSEGNKLLDIPDGLLDGFTNLVDLNCYMCRMDNLISIPDNHFNSLTSLESIRAFNDCKKLCNIIGGKITSSKIRFLIMFNSLDNNCFIPSNLINSGGQGYLMCYMFNNCNTSNKMISFDKVINIPYKRICFMSDLTIDVSKGNKLFDSVSVEYGNGRVNKVGSDDEIVNIWKSFFDTKVVPFVRDDYSDVKDLYTINLK